MIKSSSFATLMVASVLARHPTVTGVAARCSNDKDNGGAVKDETVLDNTLNGAMVALAIAFAVVTTLPPSSLAMTPHSDASQSSARPQVSQVSQASSLLNHTNGSSESDVRVGDCEAIDEDHLKSIYGYSVVESSDVRLSWTQRARPQRAFRPSNQSLQLLRRLSQEAHDLHAIPEYTEVPALTRCDSSLSMMSDFSSSTSSISDLHYLASTKKTKTSPMRNAEWAIME